MDMDEEKPPPFLHQEPSTSRAPVDFVDLTEDSDDDCMITDVKTIPQHVPGEFYIKQL